MWLGHSDRGRVAQDEAATLGRPSSLWTASLQGLEGTGAVI